MVVTITREEFNALMEATLNAINHKPGLYANSKDRFTFDDSRPNQENRRLTEKERIGENIDYAIERLYRMRAILACSEI